MDIFNWMYESTVGNVQFWHVVWYFSFFSMGLFVAHSIGLTGIISLVLKGAMKAVFYSVLFCLTTFKFGAELTYKSVLFSKHEGLGSLAPFLRYAKVETEGVIYEVDEETIEIPHLKEAVPLILLMERCQLWIRKKF